MASQDWFEKDFYATLGVPTDAGADDIKKAYRKLARIHHPDANSGDATSEKKFKEIGEAYAVLSDPEQRQQYDAVRAMTHGGARFSAGGAGGAGGPGAGGFEDLLGGLFGQGAGAGNRAGNVRYSTSGTPGGAQFDLDDLFGGIFGAGTAAPGGSGYRSPRGPATGCRPGCRGEPHLPPGRGRRAAQPARRRPAQRGTDHHRTYPGRGA
ncbi:MAG: J domain-containing protein [Kineosporiaceae bacterium]|nr:J domain-containing protein [Kineosporiaceae bacterium]